MNCFEKSVNTCESHPQDLVDEGLLNIDKDRGWTSHDVVAKFRSLLGVRKIGHTGTLDPRATGVLLLCVGPVTKLARFLVGLEKTYLATMRLGGRSDTLDAEGHISLLPHPPHITESQIRKTFKKFTGQLEQIPPMYSAIKYHGQPLHRLARMGKTVARKPRKITVRSLDLVQFIPPRVKFLVVCSSGTYIRTLAADVGDHLGCGAYIEELRRTRLGPFRVEESLTVARAMEFARRGELKAQLQPVNRGLSHYHRLVVHDRAVDVILHGRPVTREMVKQVDPGVAKGSQVRIEDEKDRLLAIMQLSNELDEWASMDRYQAIGRYLRVLI